MLRPLALALCLLAARPVIAASAGDCAEYSLAGIRLGMTLDEVRAALPTATLTAPSTEGEQGEWKLARANDRKANLPKLEGSVTLGDGKVVKVDLALAPKPGALRLSADALVVELTLRLGPGSTTSIDGRGSYATLEETRTTWIGSECGATIVVEKRTDTSYHAGAPLVFPKDVARLMRLDAAP